ncbi:MAG: VWA domain-containing protein [Peptostreptococcales bacterium]
MDNILQDFCYNLRNAGVRLSVSETLDAIKAVKHIGYGDKESFKYALNAALIKTREDNIIFEKLFESFFNIKLFDLGHNKEEFDALKDLDKKWSDLTESIINQDDRQFLDIFNKAIDTSKLEQMTYSTQQGMYVQKMMEQIGIKSFDEDMAFISEMKIPGSQAMLSVLEKKKKDILAFTEDYVKSQYELREGRRSKDTLQNRLKTTHFGALEGNQIEEMKEIIDRFAKKIYARYSKRKKDYKRGILDIKKTIRKNGSYDGMLFNLQWRYKKINRPDVFVICDISNSVRYVSHFMLLFLYSLNDTLLKIRSFVMCTDLVEVSSVFKEYKAEEALDRIYRGEDLDIMLGYTDYGQSFADFKEICWKSIKKTSTIIILGDARNNESNPHVEILKELREKCKTLIWLNPERRPMWGTNDSEMDAYLPYCHVAEECNTIEQLDKVLNSIFDN